MNHCYEKIPGLIGVGLIFIASFITPARADAPLPSALIARLAKAIDADTPRLNAIFKDLHEHPEIGFHETRTAGLMPQRPGNACRTTAKSMSCTPAAMMPTSPGCSA